MHMRIIGALLAPVLAVAGGAQGMLLMRCGPTARMDCCCPAEKAPAPSASIKPAKMECCDTLAIPAPAQATHERAISSAPVPTLVALAAQPALAALEFERAREAPRLDPPPGPSAVLVNCALLI